MHAPGWLLLALVAGFCAVVRRGRARGRPVSPRAILRKRVSRREAERDRERAVEDRRAGAGLVEPDRQRQSRVLTTCINTGKDSSRAGSVHRRPRREQVPQAQGSARVAGAVPGLELGKKIWEQPPTRRFRPSRTTFKNTLAIGNASHRRRAGVRLLRQRRCCSSMTWTASRSARTMLPPQETAVRHGEPRSRRSCTRTASRARAYHRERQRREVVSRRG